MKSMAKKKNKQDMKKQAIRLIALAVAVIMIGLVFLEFLVR